MPGIFISYRREDTAGHAGRIFDRLREKFGRDKVFMDVSGIEPGLDFVEAIDRAVGSCDVLLVIIGKKWLTCNDASGKRRLDDPKDFIRLETATALRRDIRVIPVLVQDAVMPGEGELPDDLKKLARRQATEISDTHWDSDTEQLIETLVKILPGEPKPAPFEAGEAAHVSAPAGEKRETPTPVPSRLGKNRLTWIISSITAVVVALGGLLSTIESYQDTFSRFTSFFSSPEKTVSPVPSAQPPQSAAAPEKVVVPNLVGVFRDDALVRLGQERLQPGIVRPTPSDRPTGTVIEQDPAPGSQLLPESPVNLVLAEKRPEREEAPPPSPELKPEVRTAAVPKLVGQPLEKAHLLLEKVGLKAAKAVRKETREAPEGTVIEQAPRAGTKLARGKAVELVVAAIPPEPQKAPRLELATVTVPDVTGREVREAVAMLKDAGLNIEPRMERLESPRVEPGTVLKQNLRPGSRVHPDEAITLFFAVAPRDGEGGGGVFLPDFTGWHVTAVEGFLREKGFVLGSMQEEASSKKQEAGIVLAQRPPAKTRMEKGGKVTLLVVASSGERAVLPAPVQGRPKDGQSFDNDSRTIAFIWKPVSGAASYTVELDCLHCCESGKWCAELGKPWKVIRDIPAARSPGYKFEFVGAQPGRWRVWAVDKNGREGERSPWRTFAYTK